MSSQLNLIDWIRLVLASDELLQMGHHQRREDCNLGLGWLYYSIARMQRSRNAIVVGSYRGFSPLMIARGISDNLEGGDVIFIDPSLWDDFWLDSDQVARYFRRFGIENIHHKCITTQEYFTTKEFHDLSTVDFVFLDGLHTASQTRLEFSAFEPKLSEDGVVILANTMTLGPNTYGGLDSYYISDVTFFIDELSLRPDLQLFDIPRFRDSNVLSTGLTLVRKQPKTSENEYFRNPNMPAYEELKQGTNLFNHGNVIEALPLLERAAQSNPHFASAWLAWGTALVVNGSIELGLACLERANSLGHRRARGLIAELQQELKDQGSSDISSVRRVLKELKEGRSNGTL